MPSVEYTKKRSLASGAVDDAETLDFNAQEITPTDVPETEELKTMGKAVSAVFKNVLQTWQVTTVPVNYSDIDLWREFLHSCAAREQFLFDPTGTAASPGSNIRTVTLVARRWSFNRSGLGPNLMTVSFQLEETV